MNCIVIHNHQENIMVAITPADSQLPVASRQSSTAPRQPSSSGHSPQYDVIDISDVALEKFRADSANMEMARESHRQKDNGGASWKLNSGLKEGTFRLENGNVQKIAIEDENLSIEEFKDGKLVKSITGTLTAQGAVLDTEFYDESGRVRQSIHTELVQGEKLKGGWTVGTMSRQVQWFEGGELRGEMQDQMLLQTNNLGKDSKEIGESINQMLRRGTTEVKTDVDALVDVVSVEKHVFDYFASIREYGENSKLTRDITLEQGGSFQQLTNHTGKKIGDMDGHTTRETKHKTGLSIHMRDYDADGELIRDAQFSDQHKDSAGFLGGIQRQSVDVSWFNDGELVKRSHGSMEMEETATRRITKRPGLLETLGMREDEYATKEPKTATGLLATKLVTSASDADLYMNGVASHLGQGDYNAAEGIAGFGERNRPYSIDWTDELYKDGEKTMEQRDSESARESSFYQRERGILFRKGAALTENASPVVLREISHERNVYEDGEMKSHQSMEARESVTVKMDAPDELRTKTTYENGPAGGVDTTVIEGLGGISTVDSDPNAAARGFDNELEQTLDAMFQTLNTMNGGETPKGQDRWIGFDFPGMVDR